MSVYCVCVVCVYLFVYVYIVWLCIYIIYLVSILIYIYFSPSVSLPKNACVPSKTSPISAIHTYIKTPSWCNLSFHIALLMGEDVRHTSVFVSCLCVSCVSHARVCHVCVSWLCVVCVCRVCIPCIELASQNVFPICNKNENNHKLVTCVVGKAMPSTLFFPHINKREYNHELSRKKNITKSIVSQ